MKIINWFTSNHSASATTYFGAIVTFKDADKAKEEIKNFLLNVTNINQIMIVNSNNGITFYERPTIAENVENMYNNVNDLCREAWNGREKEYKIFIPADYLFSRDTTLNRAEKNLIVDIEFWFPSKTKHTFGIAVDSCGDHAEGSYITDTTEHLEGIRNVDTGEI
jgi:hypothetical protein